MQRIELARMSLGETLHLITGEVTAVDMDEGWATVTDGNGDTREELVWLLPVAVGDDVFILEQGQIEVILGTTGESDRTLPPPGAPGSVLKINADGEPEWMAP